MADSKSPAPAPALTMPSNPETAMFREACHQRRFLVKKCEACGKVHWYPRSLCPFCFSDRTIWQDSEGKGVVYSFSVMRRVPQPYAIAYVTLQEGPTLMTNLVDCDFDAIRIGMAVAVAFRENEGEVLPVFRPAS